jgi:hypothetical protein
MKDQTGLSLDCPFWYLAKFEGEQIPKAPGLSDHEALCQDLADPQCVELIVGGRDRSTQVWRK